MGYFREFIRSLLKFIILNMVLYASLAGQIPEVQINQKVLEMFEDLAGTKEDTDAVERITEILNELIDSPIDLNTAEAEDFKKLFFLTEFQITSILNYRKEYGNYLSINELLLVPGIQPGLFNKMMYFVIISSDTNEQAKNFYTGKIKSEFITRYKRRIEIPAGFESEIDSIHQFTGRNRYLMTRYELKKGNNFSAGFIAEQDAGEPLFSNHNKYLPDHVSFFLEYSGKKLPYRLIFGDFKTGFGQGLINGCSYISNGTDAIISPEINKIKRNLSTSESNFHRGLALQTRFNKLSLSSYMSYISHDAALKKAASETDSFQYFTSINRTGLHRNIAEIKNRNTLRQISAGADMTIHLKFFSFGIHGEKISFSHPMRKLKYNPGVDPPQFSSDFFNLSIHYKASILRTYLFGEWATDNDGNTALLNGLTAQLHPLISLSMIYRNYSPAYVSFSSSAFGKTSSVKNEEGFYIGVNMYPLPFINLSFYADHYKFPHPRSNIPVPAFGNDYMIKALLQKENKNQFKIRYKASFQQMKYSRNETGIDLNKLNKITSWRFVYRSEINEFLFLETRYELTLNDEHQIKPAKGSYVGQKIVFKPKVYNYSLYATYGLFDAPDWKNRLYVYEYDLLYDFSIPVLYRNGSRFSVLLKTRILSKVDLWFKYYQTHYNHCIERGTGADKIINSSDSGIKIQLRMKM